MHERDIYWIPKVYDLRRRLREYQIPHADIPYTAYEYKRLLETGIIPKPLFRWTPAYLLEKQEVLWKKKKGKQTTVEEVKEEESELTYYNTESIAEEVEILTILALDEVEETTKLTTNDLNGQEQHQLTFQTTRAADTTDFHLPAGYQDLIRWLTL